PEHLGVDAARERVLAGLPQLPPGVEAGQIGRPVDRLDGDPVQVGRVAELRLAALRRLVRHQFAPRSIDSIDLKKATMSGSDVPIGNTRRTPRLTSASASAAGIVPPTTRGTSPAPASRSRSRTLRESVRWAPERIDSPITSTSSCTASATISSAVRLSPE